MLLYFQLAQEPGGGAGPGPIAQGGGLPLRRILFNNTTLGECFLWRELVTGHSHSNYLGNQQQHRWAHSQQAADDVLGGGKQDELTVICHCWSLAQHGRWFAAAPNPNTEPILFQLHLNGLRFGTGVLRRWPAWWPAAPQNQSFQVLNLRWLQCFVERQFIMDPPREYSLNEDSRFCMNKRWNRNDWIGTRLPSNIEDWWGIDDEATVHISRIVLRP